MSDQTGPELTQEMEEWLDDHMYLDTNNALEEFAEKFDVPPEDIEALLELWVVSGEE